MMIIGMVGYREEMKAASHLLASKIQNTKYKIHNINHKIQNTKYKIQGLNTKTKYKIKIIDTEK